MAGWYIRRGEKVIGPVDTEKLKELSGAGKLLPTDQLAKDAAGPWTVAAKTNLFAKPAGSAVVAVAKTPLAPVVESPPVQQQQQPQVESGKALSAAKAGFGALSSAGGAVARSMAERSKRKHELELAKIQAQAVADSQRPIIHQAPAPQPVYVAPAPPPPQPSVNVNVVQQVNIGGRGRKRWSRLVAMLLSIVPGLGHLYKGQLLFAIFWFVITSIAYFPFVFPGLILHFLCFLSAGMGDPYS